MKNPVKRLKYSGFTAVFLVATLYMLANIAYFAAIPKEEIIEGKTIAAGLFFTKVFGGHSAVLGLNFLIALSAFGNLVAVFLGTSRLIREAGRQGVLPWTTFWVSTKPFGTPFGPYVVKWVLTVIMILAPPAGDAFNFTTDLQVYPATFFNALMVAGLLVVRQRRRRLNLPKPQFHAWMPMIVLGMLVQLYVLILSWYPPATGATGGDVSFWYGTYIVTGIGIVVLCCLYWLLWIEILPRVGKYRMRYELVHLGNGAETHRLTKVPESELTEWDATHDASGGALRPESQDAQSPGRVDVEIKI